MIGIIGAMDIEIEALRSELQDISTKNIAGMEFCCGHLGDREVVAVISGVGKVNASICTQILVDVYHVDTVINTGIAGGLAENVNIGDIVISENAVQHDVDVSCFGYEPGYIPRSGLCFFEADQRLISLAIDVCGCVAPDVKVHVGTIASGDRFIAAAEDKIKIRESFGALCAEMEGAAIAHVATLNSIPFIIIRAISDQADGGAVEDYPEFEKETATFCLSITRALVSRM